MSNQVPYNLFAKWYKDTHKKIVPVQVLGAPSPESEMKEILSPIRDGKPEVDTRLSSGSELRILVDIRMSNGVHISQHEHRRLLPLLQTPIQISNLLSKKHYGRNG